MANLERLELRTRQVGPWSMNTYALVCPRTGQSVLIDPGDDPDVLADMLAGTTPVAILLTHTHPDHIGALDEMRGRLGAPLAAFPGPHGGIHNEGLILGEEIELRDGDRFIIGDHSLRVYHAPGHIPDQICFFLDDDTRVIVGDTIFDGGPGKTWSAEEFRESLDTLRDVVLRWPDDTVCYPGHGPHFRLGDRRAQIEAFLARDHRDFFGDATWDMAR
jgi:glyoxylase-like metal-dependent hydrolase (beta-lactamase superfamily II)